MTDKKEAASRLIKESNKPKKRYEYTMEKGADVKKLNEMGSEGWRLIERDQGWGLFEREIG